MPTRTPAGARPRPGPKRTAHSAQRTPLPPLPPLGSAPLSFRVRTVGPLRTPRAPLRAPGTPRRALAKHTPSDPRPIARRARTTKPPLRCWLLPRKSTQRQSGRSSLSLRPFSPTRSLFAPPRPATTHCSAITRHSFRRGSPRGSLPPARRCAGAGVRWQVRGSQNNGLATGGAGLGGRRSHGAAAGRCEREASAMGEAALGDVPGTADCRPAARWGRSRVNSGGTVGLVVSPRLEEINKT